MSITEHWGDFMTGNAINRLYLPGMTRTYDWLRPLAWPMLRIAAGLLMLPHGIPKLFGSFAPVGAGGFSVDAALRRES